MLTIVSAKWLYQPQTRDRKTALAIFCLIFVLWIWFWQSPKSASSPSAWLRSSDYPLLKKYFENDRGEGGRWYIPPVWYESNYRALQDMKQDDLIRYMDLRNPRSPTEAANFALEICLRKNLYLKNSKIPRIIHQTWKNTDPSSWVPLARRGAEEWLRTATGHSDPDQPQMAYVFWDDNAVAEFMTAYEPDLAVLFPKLPYSVEKADIFRIAVLRWFGGIYADIDTSPLKHPLEWVYDEDIETWTDPNTQVAYSIHPPRNESYIAPDLSPTRPRPAPDSDFDLNPNTYKKIMDEYRPRTADVAAIMGIEADTPLDTDDYWRSGYLYPVQLTNWAMALAPHHPIAVSYIQSVTQDIQANISVLGTIDPILLTGPGALTKTVKEYAELENEDFSWQSLSGLHDPPGGIGKIAAGDILVLPITGFSPGRHKFHNMGSRPIDHPNARLFHVAQGSWKASSVRVQVGKLCRTFLAGCREWSKVP